MVRFHPKEQSNVTLEIYNLLGERMEDWSYGVMDAGGYTENINMDRFPSGVYFYRIAAKGNDGANFVSIKKALLLK